MKKPIVLLFAIIIMLITFSCTALSEEARFVTIQEWLDAKGECGDCMLLLKIQEVLNPVLAIGADETGTINLYSGGENSLIIEFGNEERMLTGYWMVIGNPKYNEYEGTIEMADWALLRMIPDAPTDQLNAEIATKTDELQALQAELERYTVQMTEADAHIADQEVQIDALNAEIVDKTAQIENLKDENVYQAELIEKQEQELQALYSENVEKTNQLEQLKDENAYQAVRIKELEELVEYYKHFVHPGYSWQAIIDELNARIAQLELELEAREKTILEMEAVIEELNCRIAELEAKAEEQN